MSRNRNTKKIGDRMVIKSNIPNLEIKGTGEYRFFAYPYIQKVNLFGIDIYEEENAVCLIGNDINFIQNRWESNNLENYHKNGLIFTFAQRFSNYMKIRHFSELTSNDYNIPFQEIEIDFYKDEEW